MKKIKFVVLAAVLFLGFSAANAQSKAKPTVVIIKADWCTACQQVEPIMMDLMKDYSGKLDFVILDVTSDESATQAAAKARSLGLTSFFEANKKMTSTVAVFRGKKQLYKTAKNYSRDDYVAAFNKAVG